MKKMVAALLVLAMLALAGAGFAEEENVLNVFTWEGYFDDTTLSQFKEETGITINYSTFASNEEMLLKLQANGGSEYDIVLASDYAISAAQAEPAAPSRQEQAHELGQSQSRLPESVFRSGQRLFHAVHRRLPDDRIRSNPD